MFVMVELAASDLCNIRDHSESRAQCSARCFQVHGVSVDADEHRLLTPCQPVGLRTIRGFTWLLGLCWGLRVTTLQDGEGVLLTEHQVHRDRAEITEGLACICHIRPLACAGVPFPRSCTLHPLHHIYHLQ